MATLLDFHSLKLIDANINRLIVYTFPVYVLLLNSIIEKRLPKYKDMIVFASVQIFLFFVLGGIDLSLTFTDKLGALLALLAAISYSIYIVINQQVGKKIGSVLFTTYAVLFSFVFINIHFFSVFKSENTLAFLSDKAFFIIVVMAIFCTFLPLLLISEGIKRIGAARFSIINASGPVVTILFAFVFLSETMTIQQMIGAVSVVGILYISEKSKIKAST
ncbi:MAG: EamA family transporter [Candidatus Margulisbacteria bacterium]|nr:EamA family transporter [Candidatus Margulisiibacteriota bacterium]